MRLNRVITLCVVFLGAGSCLVASGADARLADAVEKQDVKAIHTLLDQDVDVNVPPV